MKAQSFDENLAIAFVVTIDLWMICSSSYRFDDEVET